MAEEKANLESVPQSQLPSVPHTEKNDSNSGLPLPYTLHKDLFTLETSKLKRADWLQKVIDLKCWPEQDENINYLISCYNDGSFPKAEGNAVIVQSGKAVYRKEVDESLPWKPLMIEVRLEFLRSLEDVILTAIR